MLAALCTSIVQLVLAGLPSGRQWSLCTATWYDGRCAGGQKVANCHGHWPQHATFFPSASSLFWRWPPTTWRDTSLSLPRLTSPQEDSHSHSCFNYSCVKEKETLSSLHPSPFGAGHSFALTLVDTLSNTVFLSACIRCSTSTFNYWDLCFYCSLFHCDYTALFAELKLGKQVKKLRLRLGVLP